MAAITGSANEKVFQIKAWGGLNENPDGDTKLKMGEAAVMRNFRITRDGNLQRRPGSKEIAALLPEGAEAAPVRGIWNGNVGGVEQLIAACGGKLWKLWDDETGEFIREEIGDVETEREIHFFGFSNALYMVNGSEYKVWDGQTLSDVGGYRPLVTVSVPPEGGGETLEQVNKLTGERRCWVSPDGESAVFQLPETGLQSVDYVKDLSTGEEIDPSAYSAEPAAGTVTFTEPPAVGVNTIEIGWTMGENFRSQVQSMRWGELYAGTQDTRIFLYGDGSNRAIYSGLDYDGKPRADYFPDLNEVAVGDANTPITGMIRHYSRLSCFKSDSAWTIEYGTVTLAGGAQTEAFYVTPVNRAIGNAAPGQVRLVLNSPRTLHGSDVYEWKNYSAYSANLTHDERQAKRISDRIYATVRKFDLENCYCYDDNWAQEYYICQGGRALVHNYAADAWYYYEDFDAVCMANFRGELLCGTSDGRLMHFSTDYLSNDGRAIDAYWESGSMSFGQDYQRKYSAQLWVGVKPESSAEVEVTVQTDRSSRYTEKVVTSSLANFAHVNYAKYSYATNRKPQMSRLKIKAKKFVFYKLIFRTTAADSTVTILAADIRVRFTGYVK
ncbi:MAG: hypothetical protein ACI3VA_04515 [Candidatus Limivicinus sp.]